VIGVLSALHSRSRTGLGQHVDISMFDCQLSLLNYIATMYLMSGRLTERVGNGHFVHVPYNTFRTQTRHLILAVLTDGFWHDLVDLLGDEQLRQPAFASQPGRLAAKAFIEDRVQQALQQQTCEYWLEQLALRRIPAAPVNDIAHAFEDEQAIARGMRVSVPLPGGGHVEQPGNPVKLSLGGDEVFTAPPRLGEHTARVLVELAGLDACRLEQLAADGVIQLS
jgi:crotonobetainyl-CoA:carnitine CoA-transferase CaiB-like acyl-CoA transferase